MMMGRVITLLIICYAPLSMAAGFDAQQAAKDVRSSLSGVTDSADALKANLTDPLMSSDPMRTIDGQTFTGQIACPSSSTFMEIIIQPSATGDITPTQFLLDTDLTGSPNIAYSINRSISGVCANGIISCNPGTWTNCTPYKWTATNGLKVLLESSTIDQMGGCYCINDYCGNGLSTKNMTTILKDMTGGAAAAMSAVKPEFTISRTEIDGPYARVFGQKTGSCLSGNGDLTGYANNGAGVEAAAQMLTADPDSPYTLMTDSLAAQQSPSTTTHDCSVQRTLELSEITPSVTPENCPAGTTLWSGTILGWSPMEVECTGTSELLFKIDFAYDHGTCQTRWLSFNLPGTKYYNPNDPAVSPQPILAADAVDWKGSCTFSFKTYQGKAYQGCDQNGLCSYTFKSRDTRWWNWYLDTISFQLPQPDTECSLSNEQISNTCASLESDNSCTFLDEEVDGVTTLLNQINTGLYPLPSSVTLNGSLCSLTVEREFWNKKKTYRCSHGNDSYDLTDALSRSASIKETTTSTGYTDRRTLPDGTIETVTSSMTVPTSVPFPSCQPACKTRRLIDRTAVSTAGVSTDLTTNDQQYEYFYHECSDNTCPTGTGEEVVAACQCINEFTGATALMQTMRMAGQDAICSDGTPKPLQ